MLSLSATWYSMFWWYLWEACPLLNRNRGEMDGGKDKGKVGERLRGNYGQDVKQTENEDNILIFCKTKPQSRGMQVSTCISSGTNSHAWDIRRQRQHLPEQKPRWHCSSNHSSHGYSLKYTVNQSWTCQTLKATSEQRGINKLLRDCHSRGHF